MIDLPAEMDAAVLHAPGDLRIERRPVPQPGPGELLVEVAAAGICGSDVAEFGHGPVLTPLHRAHPHTGHVGPLVLGHEFAGRVVAAGPDTSTALVGATVTSGSGVSCGRCRSCLAGRTNLCARYWTVGLHRDGGLARYCVVPERACVESADLPVDVATLSQPMAVAVHALRRGAPQQGDRVLVVGAGAVGTFLLAALGVLLPSIGLAVVADTDAARRDLAVQLGAGAAAAPDQLPADEFTLVYELSGTAAGLGTALRAVAPGGRVVLGGIQHPAAAGDATLRQATLTEVALIGTFAHVLADDLADAGTVLAHGPDWSLLAPRVLPLRRLPDILAGRGPAAVKTLFDPIATVERPLRALAS